MAVVRIDSILGGHAPTTHFAGKSQFRASLGIDPAQPFDDADSVYSSVASGLLRPVAAQNFTSSTIAAAPMWMRTNPKDANVYVLDAAGSAYSVAAGFTSATGLSDGGSLSSGSGNGAEYYDNYMYFFKNTDVARYGPLNGAPIFNGTYWTGTLSKAALTNTSYPTDFNLGLAYPNHAPHRHSDGKLYFIDVVGNQGTIHYISTTKSSVEGDTDNGSTANKLSFGYGLWPIDMDSYGTNLAIAINEMTSQNLRQARAKVAIWDTVSTNFNSITWCEFPDSLITAIRNANGSLYAFSGNYHSAGFRISQYIGGNTFKEIWYQETGEPPFAGAVDAILNRVLAGTYTTVPESAACVWSSGLQKSALGQGMFNVMRSTAPSIGTVTSLCVANDDELGFYVPIVGWRGDGQFGIDKQGTQYNNAPSVFWGPLYRIGQPFEIRRVRIPFPNALPAGVTITAKIYFDSGAASKTLTVINSTNFPNLAETGFGRVASIKMDNTGTSIGRGQNNFWLELRWTGTGVGTVELPIFIEYDVIPD